MYKQYKPIFKLFNAFLVQPNCYVSKYAVGPNSYAAGKERKAHVREEKEHERHIKIQILSRSTFCQEERER